MSLNQEYMFVSYPHKSREKVVTIVNHLRENGCSVWMDDGITVGENYHKMIAEKLVNSSAILLFLFDGMNESEYCKNEINLANNKHIPIIPISEPYFILSDELFLQIGRLEYIQYIDSSSIPFIINGIKNRYENNQESILSHSYKNQDFIFNSRKTQKKSCELVIFSPVNVDVYLKSSSNLILKVDLNSGFNYKTGNFVSSEHFTLQFISKGFQKEVSFEMPDDLRIEYHLDSILTDQEIVNSYDRDNAIEKIHSNPSGYAFEQLQYIGEIEDIQLLHEWLMKKSIGVQKEHTHRNYLIAKCAIALGTLCIRYNSFECVSDIAKVYDTYTTKSSYGYLFESILNDLTLAMNEQN